MKFIATEELGRLAKWLRILGFDTVYLGKADRRSVILKSLREDRIILTRNSKMATFTGTRLLHIDTDFVEKQLEQVIRQLNLKIDRSALFSLCVICNESLIEVSKNSVKDKVPTYVYETQRYFMRCERCGRIYWKGTHWELVTKFLDELKV